MLLWICLRWPEGYAGSPDGTAALRRLALAMLQYSPKVACFGSDSVVLEVAASLSLFGGIRRLCRRVRYTAASLSQQIRVSVAPSAKGAWLLAGTYAGRGVRRRVLSKESLSRNLNKLPLHSLPEAEPHLQWLENIGCRHLACLCKLPRQGLQQRSSPALLQALDHAYAQQPETLLWFVPPDIFRLAHEPDTHLNQAETILASSQGLLQALCGWLHSRQQALHDFMFILHHEKGHTACPPTRLALRFSAAAWRLEDFNLLLKERLHHCALQRSAIKLEIIAGPPQPRNVVSSTLFPDPSRHAQEEQRLLDLLTARLGPAAIRRPRPQAHHLPEQANLWVASPCAPAHNELPPSAGDKPRPFWLLQPPQRLAVHQERPVYQGRALRLIQGPERIETGWYSHNHQRRDYFVAQDTEGARYWVYRERETGEGWFLHGLFA